MRCTSTPMTPEPSPRRPNAAIASRARSRIARLVAVADRLQHLLAQVVEVDLLAAGSVLVLGAPPALADALSHRRRLGGAEEEALEDEVEDAPVLGRLGERRGERLAEAGSLGPAAPRRARRRRRAARRCRPRRPRARSSSANASDAGRRCRRRGVTRPAARPPRACTPTRSATMSRSVRCLTIIDIVSRKVSASMSSAPSSSSARAQSIDSAIDGGFLRSSSRTIATTSTSRARPSRRQLGRVQPDDLELVLELDG